MIYTVECSFADPAREAEWNAFYSLEKLPALISVTGFHSSQRFKSISEGCPVYLAIHTVDGLDVLTREEYRRKGGGNFARWQQQITDWHRNLYNDIGLAPDSLIAMGLEPLGMQAVALEKYPERRWLAILPRSKLHLVETLPEGVDLYEPVTTQLTRAGALPAGENRQASDAKPDLLH